ncbi:Polyketide synthase, enoylreductase domain [Fusarium oxysporum f. sp. vasinfectum]|nr:Polyketide synthase, enoylreductase domain [Fusarium oxysporum f. sp. vasinfectum]
MPKVARFHQLGGPEVLQLDEIEFEDPSAGELLLKVSAIGINRMEVFFRAGGFGLPKVFPAMLGSECAGTVLAVGSGVSGFSIGDRVATIPGFTSVPDFATEMKGHECAVYGEQAYVPAEMAVKIPNSMSFIDGAALWMQYSTAWNSMVDTAKLQKGEYVLLTAATSSVGIAAAQIAKSQGAIPICTTRSQSKVAALKSHGIEHVIVTDEQDIATEVARITGGIGCRVIYDPVAGKGIDKLLDALAMNGIILVYGVLDLSPAIIDPLKGMAKFATIKFSAVFQTLLNAEKRAKMTEFVLNGVANGVLRPVVDKTFPFQDVAEAHRYLESNQHVGKVIVTVD